MIKNLLRIFLLILCSAVTFNKASAEITVDGILDEPEWAEARVFNQFVTTQPLNSEPAKYATEVRLYTNEKGIFVGFTNYQPPSVKMIERRFARDGDIEADRNVLGIDFEGTGLSAYIFVVGSSNSIRDAVRSPNGLSSSWDGDWYSGTSIAEENWYSEIFIPWTVAPMSNNNEAKKNISVWFSRVVYSESLRFAFPNASSRRETFLQDWYPLEIEQAQASSLDWFPYISVQQDLLGGSSDNSEDIKVGLDFIWRPNSSTQLTGAINPDFGQVESDDLVVNFSAYETLLEEKRPFFTENQTLFESEIPNEDRMLHTRRIGVASNADNLLMDIDLAAKITHFSGATDYGLFVVSEDDKNSLQGSNYVATRVQNKTGNLTLGHRLTYADHRQVERQATVNAIDMDWYPSDTVSVQGQLLTSHIKQQANSVSGQIATDEQDYAGWIGWSYSPSDQWLQVLYLSHYGDNFDINDMGYMRRNDFNEFYGSTRYDRLEYHPESKYLSSFTELEYGYKENTDGDRLEFWLNAKHRRVLRSTETLFFNLGVQLPGWDDRIARGNGLYAQPTQFWGELNYSSPKKDKFSYRTKLSMDTWGTEKPAVGLAFNPKLYLTETLTLGGRLAYKYYPEWLIWDFQQQQLATFQANSYSVDFKLDWYPSDRQEVRLKFQWVGIDAQVISGYQLDDQGRLLQSQAPSSSFSFSDIALQLRYRYQLAPLSDIFIVYSRGGYYESDSGKEGASDLFDYGWQQTEVESIIAKLRYRF